MANDINYPAVKPVPGVTQTLPPEIIGKLIANQEKELELRAQDLILQKQQDDHSFEFGTKALGAQMEDRKLQRDHNVRLQRNQYILIGCLSVMVVGIIITALFLNKEIIAIEMIKAVVFLMAGGLGGYGLSKKKEKPSDTKSSI